MGIKDWVRSRPLSLSFTSGDIKKSLSLNRSSPKSNNVSEAPVLPALTDEDIARDSTDIFSTRSRAVTNNGNQIPTPSVAYEKLQSGAPAISGTYPLHGNGDAAPVGNSLGRGNSTSSRPNAKNTFLDRASVKREAQQSTSAGYAKSLTSNSNNGKPFDGIVSGQYRHSSEPRALRYDSEFASNHDSGNKAVVPITGTPVAEQFSSSNYYKNRALPGGSSTQNSNANAFVPSSHTLKREPGIADLRQEVSLQVNDETERGCNAQPSVIQSDSQSWNHQQPVSLAAPLRSGGSSPDPQVDGSVSKMAPLLVKGTGTTAQTGTCHEMPSTFNRSDPAGQAQNRSPKNSLATEQVSAHMHGPVALTPFPTPMFERETNDTTQPFFQADVKSGQQTVYDTRVPLAVQGASQAPDLRGIVDLTDTEETTVQIKTAPTVVHEIVQPEVHHVRHEVITREIHTHETYHRVLPIIDVEVLPARHFVPSNTNPGALEEISAESLPQSVVDKYNNRNWVIAETVSKPSDTPSPSPRRFTARTFEGTEGDYEEWVGDDGVKRSKTTWVHPPTIDDTLYKQGLTTAVHIP